MSSGWLVARSLALRSSIAGRKAFSGRGVRQRVRSSSLPLSSAGHSLLSMTFVRIVGGAPAQYSAGRQPLCCAVPCLLFCAVLCVLCLREGRRGARLIHKFTQSLKMPCHDP